MAFPKSDYHHVGRQVLQPACAPSGGRNKLNSFSNRPDRKGMVEAGPGQASLSRAALILIGVGGYVALVCEVIFLLSMKAGSREALLCLLSTIACMTGAAVYAWVGRSVAPEMRRTLRAAFRGYVLGALFIVGAVTLAVVGSVITLIVENS